MFKLFDNFSDDKFTWESVGNVSDGRRNLGEEMPVYVYRLFQYTLREELDKKFGGEITKDVFRGAGKLSGKEFAKHKLNLDLPFNEFIANLQDALEESKIGILRVENFDTNTGKAVLTISEDLDCSGLPITGDKVCNYDEGFLAGILEAYTKMTYIVREVDCWSTGSRVCRFEANVKESNE